MIIYKERFNSAPRLKSNDLIRFITDYESVFRFSRNRLVWGETLIHHIGMVVVIGLYMIDTINLQWRKHSPYEALRTDNILTTGNFLRKAVVHDMDEIATGDIIRPTKYANKELLGLIKELEAIKVKEVIEDYKLPKEWERDWVTAKSDEDGMVLKVADIISVLITCYREVCQFSNRQFKHKVAYDAIEYARELWAHLIDLLSQCEEDDYEEKFLYQKLIDFLSSAIEMVEQEMEDI